MKKHHRITDSELAFEETFDLSDLISTKIISKDGKMIGKVSKVLLNPKKLSLEGILIRQGVFKKPIYIGISYFDRLSKDSIILKISPSVLLKRKKVLDSEGKVIGKVKSIERKGNSNEISELIISSPLKKKFPIKMSNIKFIGKTIILKSNYNVPKKYFWQKS